MYQHKYYLNKTEKKQLEINKIFHWAETFIQGSNTIPSFDNVTHGGISFDMVTDLARNKHEADLVNISLPREAAK